MEEYSVMFTQMNNCKNGDIKLYGWLGQRSCSRLMFKHWSPWNHRDEDVLDMTCCDWERPGAGRILIGHSSARISVLDLSTACIASSVCVHNPCQAFHMLYYDFFLTCSWISDLTCAPAFKYNLLNWYFATLNLFSFYKYCRGRECLCLSTGETAVSSWARNSCDAQQWQTCSMWWHGWWHCFERFSNNEDWAHHRCPSRYFNISFICASVEGCGSWNFFWGWAIDEFESCKNAQVFWPVQLILSNRPSGVLFAFFRESFFIGFEGRFACILWTYDANGACVLWAFYQGLTCSVSI